MLGVMLDRESLDVGDLSLETLTGTLSNWDLHDHTLPSETAERIRRAHVVVSNKVVLDEAVLAEAESLKLIAIAATGTNNVDLAAAARRGIAVANVTGYATPSVVEHVFALLLALTRRFDDYRSAVARGRWATSRQFCLLDFPMRELRGRTLGIIGFGELGRAVARTAREGFGMEVCVAARPGTAPQGDRLSLDDLLRRADVVTIHTPLAPETRNLITARELALMREEALLINTARGGIVDEQALADALRAGTIAGAGIDVLAVEPPRTASPLLAPDIPNLIVTPHVAWASREARQRLVDEVVRNIEAFTAGGQRNRVA